MYRFITEMYYEDIGGVNDYEIFEDFDYYRDNLFNDDINYIILNHFRDCHHEYEQEVKDYIANFIIDYRRPELLDGLTTGNSYIEYVENVGILIDRVYKYDIEGQLGVNDRVNIKEELAKMDEDGYDSAVTEITFYRTDIPLDRAVDLIAENRVNVPNKPIWDWGRDNSTEILKLTLSLGFPFDHDDILEILEEGEERRIREYIQHNFVQFVLYGVYTQLIELGIDEITKEENEKFKSIATVATLDWTIDKMIDTVL